MSRFALTWDVGSSYLVVVIGMFRPNKGNQ